VSASRVTAHVDADPTAAFATLTDPARLPRWNAAVRRVVDAPPSLVEGAEWVVEMHVLGRTWRSRAQVVELDSGKHVFRHRSRTDDGNPSFADWSWAVTPGLHGGSDVTVSWDLHPKTFWRRALFVHVRRRQLRSEVTASLKALGEEARTMLPHG
jgi:uncharacterized protein YndB with AHSA1/START domain